MNDNKPVFAQTSYEVDVDEDADVGFAILTVSANDGDEGGWRGEEKDVCVNVCQCFFVEIMQTESQGCGSDCEASALNSDLSTFAQARR